MGFIFAVHIPIAGMSLLPVLFKWPLALLPVHILFLELIIDPACTVVFEMETDEADIMKRPPRQLHSPLFGRTMIQAGLIQGIGVFASVLTVYAVLWLNGFGEAEARMAAFVCLVMSNLGLIFTNRSWTNSILTTIKIPNRALWWISGGALGFLTLVLAVPFLRELFHFAPLHRTELAVIAMSVFASLLVSESIKYRPLQRRLEGSLPAPLPIDPDGQA
jgi:Ca2+-transporting ATPase